MRSARLFLPLSISLFMKRVSVRLPNRGSGGTSRFTTRARRGMLESPFERSKRNEPCSSGTEDRRDLERAAFVKVPGGSVAYYPLLQQQVQFVSAYFSVSRRMKRATLREPSELSPRTLTVPAYGPSRRQRRARRARCGTARQASP